jgi:hypothetical protein
MMRTLHILTRATLRHARRILGVLAILTAVAAPVLAQREGPNDGKGKRKGADPPPAAPEIDPGSILGGLTLLIGGALILADRSRR